MEEKKNDRRVYAKFALIMLAALIVGCLLGFGILWCQNRLLHGQTDLYLLGVLAGGLPVAGWGVGILAFLTALFLFFRCKGRAQAWDGEDETLIEDIEHKLNTPLTIANVSICLDFLYYTLLTAAVKSYITPGWSLVGILAFLFNLAAYLVTTALVVGLEKKLNPEKRGNVLDTKFQKKWVDSCDEAEQQMIQKAAFFAYRAGSAACLVLWMVTALAQLAGFMGPWPGIMLVVVWLVLVVSYTVSCLRQNRQHGPL